MIEPTQQDLDEPGAVEDSRGTGDLRVDAVLHSLSALDEISVSEHVAVFEAAHTALREALSGPVEA